MYLLKKQTALSIKKIGRLLCRDHSSVVHGVQSIQNRMDTEPDIYNEVMALLNYDQKQIIADIMHDDEQSGIYE